jgi:hypothetical protein
MPLSAAHSLFPACSWTDFVRESQEVDEMAVGGAAWADG